MHSTVTQGLSLSDVLFSYQSLNDFGDYENRYRTILTARRPNGREIIFTEYHGKSRPPYLTDTDFFPNHDLKPALTLVNRVERLEGVFPHIQTTIDHNVIGLFIGIFGDEMRARDELKRLAVEKNVRPFL